MMSWDSTTGVEVGRLAARITEAPHTLYVPREEEIKMIYPKN